MVFGPGGGTPSAMWLSRSPQHRLALDLFLQPSASPPQSRSPARGRAAAPGCAVGLEPPRQWGSLLRGTESCLQQACQKGCLAHGTCQGWRVGAPALLSVKRTREMR